MNEHKKILIDGRMIGWTGIGRYSIELLNNLQEIDNENEYVVLVRGVDWEKWLPSKPNFTKIRADVEPYSFAEQMMLPGIIRAKQPDLVHFLSFNSPIAYWGKRVTTVHDITLITHSVARGSLLNRLKYALKNQVALWQLKSVLSRSEEIITDTQFGRQDLANRGFINLDQGVAIPLGAEFEKSSSKKNRTKPFVTGKYLLYVGNYYPYKNIVRLIDALPSVIDKHPGFKLILVGRADEFKKELNEAITANGVEESVVFTGFVTDSELANLYQHASLYVFPSLSEGFGLPGLEAMSYGLPVAASTATCIPEVLGDAAVYFDPVDTTDMARVIDETLSDPKRRAELKKAGLARVKQFSWKRMAEQTLEVYNRVLEND
jgi:glycosyltransferase involved in cell wall biosynthesis